MKYKNTISTHGDINLYSEIPYSSSLKMLYILRNYAHRISGTCWEIVEQCVDSTWKLRVAGWVSIYTDIPLHMHARAR